MRNATTRRKAARTASPVSAIFELPASSTHKQVTPLARLALVALGGLFGSFDCRFPFSGESPNSLPSRKTSGGESPDVISNRHKPELELPVTYRKQRVASFLIATFRTLFRVATLASKLFAHCLPQFSQRPASIHRPTRFGLAASPTVATMGN